MKKFKFFQKPVKGDLTMLDGQTHLTASHNMFTQGIIGATGSPGTTGSPGISLHEWDTPEGYNYRRILYHTNRGEYERLRQEYLHQRLGNTNDDRERYFIENSFRGLTRDLNDNRIEKKPTRLSKFLEYIEWKDNKRDILSWLFGSLFVITLLLINAFS